MDKTELKRVFEHRLSKFNHLLKMHSDELEIEKKHQIIGAMNEISVMLKTLENN